MPDSTTPADNFDDQYTNADYLFPHAKMYPDMALANEGGAVIARGPARLGLDPGDTDKLRTCNNDDD